MRADISGKGHIQFEGVELPEAAKHFDVLPCFRQLPNEMQSWIHDLEYAWARQRTAPSALVLRCLGELEARILREQDGIREHLRKALPELDTEGVLIEWLSAIMLMRNCAERVDHCVWTVEPEVGEVPHFLGVVTRIYRSMIRTQNSKRPPTDPIEIPKVLETIETRNEDEQIAFINLVIDALSDNNAA